VNASIFNVTSVGLAVEYATASFKQASDSPFNMAFRPRKSLPFGLLFTKNIEQSVCTALKKLIARKRVYYGT
jgi:hypothetical protein